MGMVTNWQEKDYLGDPRFIPMDRDTFELLIEQSREQYDYELVGGILHNMAPPTQEHEELKHNLFNVLKEQLGPGGPCRVMLEQYVEVPDYPSPRPDITLTCNLSDWRKDQRPKVHRRIQSPLIVAEILSPSTQDYDRSEKFERLKHCETLKVYLLIHYDAPQIEVYRHETGWAQELYGAGQTIQLDQLDLEIEVDAVYQDVQI